MIDSMVGYSNLHYDKEEIFFANNYYLMTVGDNKKKNI